MGSEYVEYLFFDLFQFVFHSHHHLLHRRVVRLGTDRVDLPTDLLTDEAQLLARGLFAFQHLDKIVEVGAEADFLLGDVELLDVEDEFLLEAVAVEVVLLDELVERALQPFAHLFDAACFVRLQGRQSFSDTGDAFTQVLAQSLPFVLPEFVETMHRFLQTTQERVPFFFRQTVSFIHQHLGQAEQDLEIIIRLLQAEGLLGRLQLRVIRLEQRQVHGSTLTRFLRLDPDRAFHLAAFDKTVQLGAQLEFLFPVLRGQAEGQVEELAVHRLDLHRDGLGGQVDRGGAEAGHGTDHGWGVRLQKYADAREYQATSGFLRTGPATR